MDEKLLPEIVVRLPSDQPVPDVFVQAMTRRIPLSIMAYVIDIHDNQVVLRITGRPIPVVTNLRGGQPFDPTQ